MKALFVRFASISSCALVSLVGCSDDDTGTGSTGGTSSSATTGTSSGGGGDEQRTLDNCETNIAEGVPEFYKTHFRCVDIEMSGADVVISTRNLPPHPSAYYPTGDPNYVAFDTSGGNMQIPGTIVEQDITLTIPSAPVAKGITIDESLLDGMLMTSDEEYRPGATGVALNSVAFFSGAAAMGMNVADEARTFDAYEAHHANGNYHYHGQTPGPLEVLERAGIVTSTTPGDAEVELYAIMCDGTLVLGCTELDGSAPSTGDLDAQGGHTPDIADEGGTQFTARYHTHVCPAGFKERTGTKKEVVTTLITTHGLKPGLWNDEVIDSVVTADALLG